MKHENRQKHANNRKRMDGGRFLKSNDKNKEDSKTNSKEEIPPKEVVNKSSSKK